MYVIIKENFVIQKKKKKLTYKNLLPNFVSSRPILDTFYTYAGNELLRSWLHEANHGLAIRLRMKPLIHLASFAIFASQK